MQTLYRGVPYHQASFIQSPSAEGTWGSGTYYAGDQEAARIYADEGNGYLLTVEADIRNPFVFRPSANYPGELYGAELVDALFPADEAQALIAEQVARDSFHFGSAIRCLLMGRGHDALDIVYYDGSREVALYPKCETRIVSLHDVNPGSPDFDTELYSLYVANHGYRSLPVWLWERGQRAMAALGWAA